MKVSIVLTTYNRSNFLYHALGSISRQDLSGLDLEVLVINDGLHDESESVCLHSDVAQGLNVRYIHSGKRHGLYWRCMGYAANVGIRQAYGDVVVLTNSDIYHIGDTIRAVVEGCEQEPMALSTVHQVYDDPGLLIDHLRDNEKLEEGSREAIPEVLEQVRRAPRPAGFWPCNPDVPFCLAVRREHLMRVGGYDEQMIGSASEDCDLLDRLKAIGCRYRYAQPGVEAIHLYHGRRSIKELEALPGFWHNLNLRRKRKTGAKRNVGRVWGRLPNPDRPQASSPMSLVLWVTSRCNLTCPLCSQQNVRDQAPDYDMTMGELKHFIKSCVTRKIRFADILLSGGEPTVWPLFEDGVALLSEAGIAERVTFITNGHQPELAAKVANQHHIRYVLSASQCDGALVKKHLGLAASVLINDAPHRRCPTEQVADALPAECSQRTDLEGEAVRQLLYHQGRVWYCCTALANAMRIGAENDPALSCPFEGDFDLHFFDRKFDNPICGVCMSNEKVWRTLE